MVRGDGGLPPPAGVHGVSQEAEVVGVEGAEGDEIGGLVALVAGVAITALTGLAMMSNFRYPSFKEIDLSRRVPFGNLMFMLGLLIVVALEPAVVIFCMFFVYVTSAPVLWAWRLLKRRRDFANESS